MKILQISTRMIIGGSQESIMLACARHVAHGHVVHLAYGPIYGPEGSMVEEGTEAQRHRGAKWEGIELHEVPDLVRQISPRRDIRAYQQLRRLIQDLDPDIVHTHSSKAGVLGRMAGWAEGGHEGQRGVVHTIHGPPFHKYLPTWKNRIYIEAERYAASRCHRIISVADAMTSQYLAKGIGNPEQYVTIHTGLDFEPYSDPSTSGPDSRAGVRTELGLGKSDIVVGTISRLAELKGHDDLIEALGDDLKANPGWKLLWVGDGWKRQELEAKLDAKGLREHVVMTGLVPPDQVARYVRAMDLTVLPSYREGLPRVVPQSLLSGVPVVAYDVDGTGEACINMQTGRLVAPGDLAGLREAINWTIENLDGKAKTLGAAGRELCRAQFDIEKVVQQTEEMYAALLDDRRHRH